MVLVMAVLFGLVGAGCGGGDDSGGRPRATIPVSEEANPTESDDPAAEEAEVEVQPAELGVEEEVEAAYLEANRVFFSLMEDPEQDLAELEATRTGDSLEHIRASVERRRSSGERSRYPTGYPVAEVLAVEVDGDDALLMACEPNDAIVTAEDGSVINDDVVAVHLEVELHRTDGGWKVFLETLFYEYEGVDECEL